MVSITGSFQNRYAVLIKAKVRKAVYWTKVSAIPWYLVCSTRTVPRLKYIGEEKPEDGGNSAAEMPLAEIENC
jgi:hypothetical protein